MKNVYRLEVGRRQSEDWAWFLRLARRMPSYNVIKEDGLELHVIETTSVANLAGLYEVIRKWHGWALLVDGSPTTKQHLADLIALRRKTEMKLPAPKRQALTPEQKAQKKFEDGHRKAVRDYLAGWSDEGWREFLAQLPPGTTREQATKSYEDRWIAEVRLKDAARKARRSGPDPKLGF